MGTKERLLIFINNLGLAVSRFEKTVELSNGYVNNIRKSISHDVLEKITSTYPQLEKKWLILGEGEMLVNGNNAGTSKITMAPAGRFPKRGGAVGLVKFYDVDFAAGDIAFYDDNNTITPAYEMDIPEFAGCTSFRTYGDSMEPAIKSGSILFATIVEDWSSHLEYGQIYGIVCTDKRKYLKYIRKDKDRYKSHFLLRSENLAYDDFELPKNKIKAIWLIHGWINKRS